MSVVALLTDEDLQQLGVTALGHRRRILAAAEEVQHHKKHWSLLIKKKVYYGRASVKENSRGVSAYCSSMSSSWSIL